jgi:Mg-chelatase subunit ChlD
MDRHKLSHFAPPERLERLCASLDSRIPMKKFRLTFLAISLLVLAMARPMLSPRATEATAEGCDFFFVLDVSKSMLVRDVEPNRLESVKTSLLRWMKTRRSDRIGLILLAGDAFVQAPLTHDLAALRSVLEQSGPSSISRGGTHLAGAMEATMDALKKSGMPSPVAVLISDGGATEGDALEVIEKARQRPAKG